jgi:hypothetical protein
MKISNRRRKENAILAEFVNALRECLGKEPLHRDAGSSSVPREKGDSRSDQSKEL